MLENQASEFRWPAQNGCEAPHKCVNSQFPTPKSQPLPIPNSQLPTVLRVELGNWRLGVGSGWKLGVGSWELTRLVARTLQRARVQWSHAHCTNRSLAARTRSRVRAAADACCPRPHSSARGS